MNQEKDNLGKLEKQILHLKSNFSNYNVVRMREALRYLSGPKLELFIKIPFLIHVNLPEFPGFIDSDIKAHGIHNFEQSGFYKEVLKQDKMLQDSISRCKAMDPCVQGFYHIGSLGTFTQSSGSDFDYWVIIDKEKFSDHRYYNLEKKLDHIVKLSREDYGQEVTFFIMDQENIKKNCYARFKEQETLTAPKIFLKEEFYRTFLMIAGKIPLWTILPHKSNLTTYNSLVKSISSITRLKLISQEFIDLGYIEKPGNQDILKGLLWHICKSRFDPIKALIKSSMIFSYGLGKPDQTGLLCDEIKAGYAKAGIDDYSVDPYKLLFDRIIKFHLENDPKGLSLIKNAIFLRLCGYPQVLAPEAGSPKKQLLDWYIRNWNLNQPQVDKMFSYTQWAEPEKLLLERTIIDRLAKMYQARHKEFTQAQTGKDIPAREKRNFKILTHKTKERLNRAKEKIPECSTYLKRQKFQLFILLQKKINTWHLSAYLEHEPLPQKLYTTSSLLGLMGWILENQLYERALGSIKIDIPSNLFESYTTPVDPDRLYMALQPLKPLSDDIFEENPSWSKLMILLIYTRKKEKSCLKKAEFLIANTWGELFLDILELDTKKTMGDKYKDIAVKINGYKKTGQRLYFFQLASQYDSNAVFEIKQHLGPDSLTRTGIPDNQYRDRPLLDKL
jgi:adenylate cyclase class 1